MDSSRSQQAYRSQADRAAQRTSHVPTPPPRDTYPYATPAPTRPAARQQPVPPHAGRQPWEQTEPQQRVRPPALTVQRNSTPRRLLGVVAFFALTAASLPVHVLAVFFVFVEFESPGDTVTAVLLIAGAFVASFLALLVTGVLSQAIGGFPGRWRARITFAALSAIIALGLAYLGALTYF